MSCLREDTTERSLLLGDVDAPVFKLSVSLSSREFSTPAPLIPLNDRLWAESGVLEAMDDSIGVLL